MTAATFGEPRLPEHFWSKVVVDCETGCWTWIAAKANGYGRFTIGSRPTKDSRQTGAHRLAYITLVAPVARELDLDHLCRRPACVNPAHLEPVTHAENVRRGRGREAAIAMHAAKMRTHCVNGHAISEYRSIQKGTGARVCLGCSRMAWQRYIAKKGVGWRRVQKKVSP
jgi:hypothetical protein